MAQSFNAHGMLYYPIARYLKKELAVPHFMVENLTKIDPEKLKFYGFKGLVFDKDNTLTAPYVNQIHPSIENEFEDYRRLFGDNIVILSNSAGTKDDKHYMDALEITNALGINVLKHKQKKPGGIGAVAEYFGVKPNELVMFGDRVFTDIVFGNRYGMLTVHVALLSKENDNKAAAKIRDYEIPLVKKLVAKGIKAPEHKLYHADICIENLLDGGFNYD